MKIEIYGATWCTFCESAKKLCENNELIYDYIDIDDTVNLRALEERIGAKVRTVPQIFADGKLIPGGFTGFKSELEKTRA